MYDPVLDLMMYMTDMYSCSKGGNGLKNCSDDKNLGICLQKPSNEKYTTVASRIRSFSSWQKTSPRPVDLADAGFFFTGQYKYELFNIEGNSRIFYSTYTHVY